MKLTSSALFFHVKITSREARRHWNLPGRTWHLSFDKDSLDMVHSIPPYKKPPDSMIRAALNFIATAESFRTARYSGKSAAVCQDVGDFASVERHFPRETIE